MAVILANKINTVQAKDKDGRLSTNEYQIGALASNIAFGDEQSEISVQDKIETHDNFIKNLSTDNVKYKKNDVTQTLTEYLEKNITTDNKSIAIVEQGENDDSTYVTPKGVIDYLTKKTNTEIKSTAEVANNNLVTDNAVFKYVKILEDKLPIAAENLDESENPKYVTVELFNSKYISMFEGELADETDDTTTLVNPKQVVTYVKSKTETGEIKAGSNKLVTSGTLYNKFAELNFPSKASIISSSTEDNDSYVTPLIVKNYVSSVVPSIYKEISGDSQITDFTDMVTDGESYVSPVQTVNYLYTKYIGTVENVYENVENEYIFRGKKVNHTPIKNIIPESESTLDINNIYFKGFVTPKQLVDYVKVASEITDETVDNTSFVTPLQVAEYVKPKLNVDRTLNFQDMTSTNAIAHSAVVKEFTYVKNFLGVSTYNEDGSYAGNTIPQQLQDILTRLIAVEEAVKIETTTG